MMVCREVTKRFGDFTAVDRLSFQIDGGVFALLGPNGAGKSTLLKILTGLLRPDSGEVRIDGLNLAEKAFEVRRRIGVVPEDLGLFDALTIQEHLELCGRSTAFPLARLANGPNRF
jgi:ABC-2 type transport system ATP-binding protein